MRTPCAYISAATGQTAPRFVCSFAWRFLLLEILFAQCGRRPFGTITRVIESGSACYTARVCWNSQGWRFPTGEAAHLESGSYVAEAGFGHEEWLFNFGWLIDGFHYAFLQPVQNSLENLTGTTIDVLLYTINPLRDRLYVGKISQCEVLQRQQAEHAHRVYKERLWLKSIEEQVANVSSKAQYVVTALDLFNIRFRPEKAEICDPLRIAPRTDAVWKRSRYTLGSTTQQIENQWRSRKGTTSPPVINTITRKGTPGLTYDPVHKRLQADLLSQFEARYGKGNVSLESDYVDITVRTPERTVLVEIKTTSTCRAAVRDARVNRRV